MTLISVVGTDDSVKTVLFGAAHVNGKSSGGGVLDVEEKVRDVCCRTDGTLGFTKSLVAAVNRGSGVVTERPVATSRRPCLLSAGLWLPAYCPQACGFRPAGLSFFASRAINSNGSTWHMPLVTDVAQGALPTWHTPLVTGMAQTFTYRHGTRR